jgi:hypothetical protein
MFPPYDAAKSCIDEPTMNAGSGIWDTPKICSSGDLRFDLRGLGSVAIPASSADYGQTGGTETHHSRTPG